MKNLNQLFPWDEYYINVVGGIFITMDRTKPKEYKTANSVISKAICKR